jgi:tight adherence protein B
MVPMKVLSRHVLQPVRHPGSDRSTGPAAGSRSVPRWISLVAEEVEHRVEPAELLVAVRVASVAAPLGVALLLGPASALFVVGVGAVAPRLLLPLLVRRQAARRDEQLAGALERVAAGVRSGSSITIALDELAGELADPLGSELRAIAEAVRHGMPLGAALDSWAGGPTASREVTLAAAALALGAAAGGPVARALDGVAATLRERRQLQAEVRALATQARASAWLLALAPVGFAGLMSTVAPDAVAFLVTTPVGLLCLGAGLTLDVIGAVWMARVVGRAA